MFIVRALREWLRRDRESNLVSHAKRELALISGSESDPYSDAIEAAVLDIVSLFSKQGHSGFSAAMVTSMVERLMRFEPLSPLTGRDEEWNEVGDDIFQNKRCSHVFKEHGEAYDINGIIFREPSGTCFTGSGSRVPVTFPYTPKSEYRDVLAETEDA